jgi:hypothetical protein
MIIIAVHVRKNRQYGEWQLTRPLSGFDILHNVPLFQNTLLKIACIVSAGAKLAHRF